MSFLKGNNFQIEFESGGSEQFPVRAVFLETDDDGLRSVTDIIEGTPAAVRNMVQMKLEELL